MGKNCAALLADLFFYSCKADFMHGFLNKKMKKLTQPFNFTFSCIDDVLQLNNSSCGDFVDSIYHIELAIKDTTDTDMSASSKHLKIDIEGWLRTNVYYKRDNFNFPIVNFPFICSNIPAAPACGAYISQLIRYSRV